MTPVHPPRLDVALLDRYLAGVCTTDEADTVAAWLATVPEGDGLVEVLQRLDHDPATRDPVHEAEQLGALRARLEARLRVGVGTTGLSRDTLHLSRAERRNGGHPPIAARLDAGIGRLWIRAVVGGAAALAIGLVAVLSWSSRAAGPHITQHVYATDAGQQATIILPDDSRLILAPRSRLIVPDGFGATTRTVTLQGEAYFDIASTSGVPFLVNTGTTTTRVLGTSFDVRYYAVEGALRVAVVSGKVSMHGAHGSVIVPAGAVARMTDSSAPVLAAEEAAAYVGWTEGRLAFDNVPLGTVLESLGRWYGYDFQLADSALAQRRITAVFTLSDRTHTLASIEKFFDVTMTFHDTTVTIRPNHFEHHPASSRQREAPVTHREVGK